MYPRYRNALFLTCLINFRLRTATRRSDLRLAKHISKVKVDFVVRPFGHVFLHQPQVGIRADVCSHKTGIGVLFGPNDDNNSIIVKRIVPGGPGFKDGRIRPGQTLVRVRCQAEPAHTHARARTHTPGGLRTGTSLTRQRHRLMKMMWKRLQSKR